MSMATVFTDLVIDCHAPELLASFWQEALGCRELEHHLDSQFPAISIRGGGSPLQLNFTPVREAKAVKNRLHIDLRPRASTQSEEVDRLLKLGATRADVGQGAGVSWVVLADPEGNEFCVLRTPTDRLEDPGPS